MGDMSVRIKSAFWTEAEVATVAAGAMAANKFLSDQKIFKSKFVTNPEWFQGGRLGAPFQIKWSGALKAGAAVGLSTFVKNPWLKLALMGVALQGTIQQFNILTFNSKTGQYRYGPIGRSTNELELDNELKRLAQNSRMSGPEDLGNRYKTSVGGNDPGNRYETSVGAINSNELFGLNSTDSVSAF